MFHFWGRNLPALVAGAAVTAVCLAASQVLPVSGWVSFFAWGLAYTALFAASLWLIVLDGDEKRAISARLPFLR